MSSFTKFVMVVRFSSGKVTLLIMVKIWTCFKLHMLSFGEASFLGKTSSSQKPRKFFH